MLGKSKKGQLKDTLFIPILLFAIIIVSVLLAVMSKNINDELLNDPDMLNNVSKAPLTHVNGGLPVWLDNGILFLFAGLIIALLLACSLIDVHPVFLVIGFLFFIGLGVVLVGLQEFGTSFVADDASFVSMMAGMPKTTWLLNNYFYIFVVVFFMAVVILFAKRSTQKGMGNW